MKKFFHAALLTSALAGSSSAVTVGNSLGDRGNVDSYSGQIFLLNADLSSLVGQEVQSWSFFNNQASGRAVTPVMVEDTSGTLTEFTMRGIGSTIVGTGAGVEGGAFSLTTGTDIVGSGYYLGYYDGAWDQTTSTATPNMGGVEWDNTDDPPVAGEIDSTGSLWLHAVPDGNDNPANMGVGAVNPHDVSFGGVVDTRHHSLQFTVAPVPEPSAMLLSGIVGVSLLLRRKRI